MKKIVITLALMVGSLMSQANTETDVPEVQSYKDSVIVNYKRSKMVLHADKIASQDLLKEVDDLLKTLKKTDNGGNDLLKDTTLVVNRNGNEIRVVSQSNAPERSVETARERGGYEDWKKERDRRRWKDRNWNSDFDFDDVFDEIPIRIPVYWGFTNFAPASSDPLLGLNTWASRNFQIGLMWEPSIAKRRTWTVRWGFEYSNFSLRFSENPIISKATNRVEFTRASGVQVSNSRLSVNYWNAVMMLRRNFKSGGLRYFSFGGYAGLRGGTNTILCTENPERVTYEYTDYHLNDFRYGVRMEIGIRRFIGIYAQYDLNKLFKDNRGPELNLISFGIKIF
jgi:hypothetical protein